MRKYKKSFSKLELFAGRLCQKNCEDEMNVPNGLPANEATEMMSFVFTEWRSHFSVPELLCHKKEEQESYIRFNIPQGINAVASHI